MALKGGHTRGMTEVDDKPGDDHRERREVEPIGLVVLARIGLAVNPKVKSETHEEEDAYVVGQRQSEVKLRTYRRANRRSWRSASSDCST